MNKTIKNRWVTALRSGGYEQGAGCLTRNKKFCCLGVLCDLAVKDGIISAVEDDQDGDVIVYYGEDMALLPQEVMKWAGLTTIGPHIGPNTTLTHMNDSQRYDFNTIADAIEGTPDDWDGRFYD